MARTASLRPARLAIALVAVLVAACGGGNATSAPTTGSAASPGAGTLPSGMPVTDLTKLCDLLGPGDFAAAGIAGAAAPTVNSDGPGTAYCVYAGQSAGTGGVEFDIFVGEDAADTYQTILDEATGDPQPVTIPGVAAAVATDGTPGQADAPASVVVRTDNLAFTIAAPGGTGVSAKLAVLAGLVVARAAGLAG
jgi:hypothetical protein